MKKKIEDIQKKRSIQDISITRRRESSPIHILKTHKKESGVVKKEYTEPPKNDLLKKYNFDYNIDRPEKESRKGLWISIFVFLIALVFGLSALFVSAEIKIISKEESFPLKISLTAKKDQPSGEFGYQIVSVENTVTKTVEATSEENVDLKASGTITVLNETTTTQKLIANTRFETDQGFIYRIKDAITVPSAIKVNNKIVPGSLDVTVFADQTGEKYNIATGTFSIPGLKSDPRYSSLKGKLKTPITGGFSGKMKIVDENLKKTSNIELSAELKKNLLSQISSQIPDNFIYYPESIEYIFEDIKQQNASATTATLTKKGSALAIIFDNTVLSEKIIEILREKNSIIDQSSIISNLSQLKFNLSKNTKSENGSFSDLNEISIDMEGDANVLWIFDETVLKNDILGIKKKDMASLLKAKYPSVNEARVKIFPFWKTTFPIEPDKIKITKVESF